MGSLSFGVRATPADTTVAAAAIPSDNDIELPDASTSPVAAVAAVAAVAVAAATQKISTTLPPIRAASNGSRSITSGTQTIDTDALRDRRFTPLNSLRHRPGPAAASSAGPSCSPSTSASTTKSQPTRAAINPSTTSPSPAPGASAATSSRAKLDAPKVRRQAKLRHRAATMEPPVLSFYGTQPLPLPSRFASVKKRIIGSDANASALTASWGRLIAALKVETDYIARAGSDLIPAIDFADIENPSRLDPFSAQLKKCGVGVVKKVVPSVDAERWVHDTKIYLETKHDIKPPTLQDPTCFDFFWTPAQILARAHPNVLRAMGFAMGLWDTKDDTRMVTSLPISYADRLRIHVSAGAGFGYGGTTADKAEADPDPDPDPDPEPADDAAPTPEEAPTLPTNATVMAQIDGGSLERWEPDGYGRTGTYDAIFAGDWESYDPWKSSGRVNASTDLYNGAGACSIFRMFQGLLALTPVRRGVVKLLPSPKLVTAYFLLRPFFKPKTPAPEVKEGPEWEAFLAAENWKLERDPSRIIHGAVPGHAQRVTENWHPHLDLASTLVALPSLGGGDYIVWHCDMAYTITSGVVNATRPATPERTIEAVPAPTTAAEEASAWTEANPPPLMVYAPACPLTQTNALYLARQRKAFLRGHPGPDFDFTGTGLGTEAPHVGRLGEKEIREVGGEVGLRAMGLAPWDLPAKKTVEEGAMEVDEGHDAAENGEKSANGNGNGAGAEAELVRLANIILFPDKYEFYMAAATRASTPERTAKAVKEEKND